MLLDTNALIWMLIDSPKLGTAAREQIRAGGPVLYSSVSVTEIVVKHTLGKLDLPGGERFPEAISAAGLLELPLTSAHAYAMRAEERLTRHDPFDRMLLAQARAEGIPLLTSDTVLLGLGDRGIVDARR